MHKKPTETPLALVLKELFPNEGIQQRIARVSELTDIPSTTLRSYAVYGVQPSILNAYAIFGAVKELAWSGNRNIYDKLTLDKLFPASGWEPETPKEVGEI